MAKKQVKEKAEFQCRDCVHSFDWHEIAHDTGEPFMCRCPFFEKGERIKFLKDEQCEKFKLKVNGKKEG